MSTIQVSATASFIVKSLLLFIFKCSFNFTLMLSMDMSFSPIELDIIDYFSQLCALTRHNFLFLGIHLSLYAVLWRVSCSERGSFVLIIFNTMLDVINLDQPCNFVLNIIRAVCPSTLSLFLNNWTKYSFTYYIMHINFLP